jgi:Domain of Unknown Function (DUF349)
MALLDRLRPQPAWKNPDPSVRLAAVEGLAATEQPLLATIARHDESPRVRRAAVSRLSDLDGLLAAQEDSDGQVRAEALARLVAMATDSQDVKEALRALAAVDDERQLAGVARSARLESVARAALERVQEPRALGGTARHGQHEAVRLRALERLEDQAELESVALHTDHRDVGLAALERLDSTIALDAVAERAKNKVVAKRARVLLREKQMREAEVRAAAEARARRQAQIGDALALVERSRDLSRVQAEIERLVQEWETLLPASPELLARYEAALARRRECIDRLQREEAAAAAGRAAREEALARRRALIAEVEKLEGPEAAGQLASLRAEWQTLEPLSDESAALVGRQFASACATYEARLAAQERATAARAELETLASEAQRLSASADLEAARGPWGQVSSRWRTLTAGLALDRELYDRFQSAAARWKSREQQARDEAARIADEQRARVQSLVDRVTALAAAPSASLKDLDHAIRDIRAALEHAAPVPGTQDALVRLKALQGALIPRLRELRETDEWRRWANAGIQEELCRRVESLRTAPDLGEVARQLRDLRRQWKAVSAGPVDERDALWVRFKSAADDAQSRCDEHFAKLATEQAAHLARKMAIIEQAEGLAQSTDWIATADTLKRLQAEWNTIGSVPKEQAAEAARRFRVACDTFFTRRKTDLAERKQVWADNAQKKDALCVRAEELAESSDWPAAIQAIKQLQVEWKAIGPVRKNRSEALWKRFRGACDRFFERYGRRHEIEHQQRTHESDAICQAVEGLMPAEGAPAPDGLVQSVEEVWQRWQRAPHLPPDVMQTARTRFDAALLALVTRFPDTFRGSLFDAAEARRRRVALCDEVEALIQGGGDDASATPAATLATRLKESLAANTIGGRANEDGKLRAAADRVRRAQAAWRELGPLPGDEGRELDARFHRAQRRFFDQHPQLRHQGGPPPRSPKYEVRRPK